MLVAPGGAAGVLATLKAQAIRGYHRAR
jgi:hypothetical protein